VPVGEPRARAASSGDWSATPRDAGALLALKRVLERETSFMLLEPDERTTTEPEAAEELRSTAARPNSVVFVADSGRARGYVEPNGGAFQRNLKTAYVVIGVRRSHAAGGIGRQLLSELERWAPAAGLLRLELTVMTSSERAVGLYRKLGYRAEGTRQQRCWSRTSLSTNFGWRSSSRRARPKDFRTHRCAAVRVESVQGCARQKADPSFVPQ
jgi:ribosomal protein S18 acetylase RimI-like enzyme